MISAKTLFLIIGVSIILIIAIVVIVNKRKNTSSSSSKSKPKQSSQPKSEKSSVEPNDGPSSSQTAALVATGGASGIIGYLLFTKTGNILLLVAAGLFVVFILFIWYFWANMASGFSNLFKGAGAGIGGLFAGLGSGSSGKKPINKNSYRYRWLQKRGAKHLKDGSYRVYNKDHWESWWYDPATGKWSYLKGLPSWENYDVEIAPDGTKTYIFDNGEDPLVVTPEMQEYDAEWWANFKQRERDPIQDTLDDRYLF